MTKNCFARIWPGVIFIVLWTGLAEAAESWPTTSFEVFVGQPNLTNSAGGRWIQQAVEGWVDMDEAKPLATPPTDLPGAIAIIERLMGESATELERLGFRAPLLEPLVERADGSLAYRVYLFDDNGPQASPARYAMASGCSDARRSYIMVNGLVFKPDGLQDKTYQDIAHELFHAVQRAYPMLRKHCGVGDWLNEGSAQALGADLAAWSSFGKNYPNRAGGWVRDRWGTRNYEVPLWRPDDDDSRYTNMFDQNDAYGTSSFWRYLGEHVARSGAADLVAVKPNYSYLADWFEAPFPGPAGPGSEMEWLESRLRTDQRFKLNLSRIYANFITTFASYYPGRFVFRGAEPSVAQDHWLERAFPASGCPRITLAGQKAEYRGTLAISKNAAHCLRLELDYEQPLDLHIEVSGAPLERMLALSVGTAQGRTVVRPTKKDAPGASSVSWVLHIDDPSPDLPWPLVFSNVSSQPEDSEPINATVSIVPGGFKHNMLPEPAKKATRPKRASTSGAGKAPAQTGFDVKSQSESVGQALDDGLDEMNTHLADNATVSSDPDATPCREAFVTQACGPMTQISLVTVAGIFSSVSQSTGRGGAMGQFMSMLSGVAAVGPNEVADRYADSLRRAEQYEGSFVHITLPLIDYGFAGSFDNALITVNKKGGGNLESIGPVDIQPGPGQQFALSGSVTVEEFSTALMRGTFSATLVDPDDIENMGDDGALPVKGNIAGSFQIAVPWMEDDRVHRETADDLASQVTDDITGFMAGTNSDLEVWTEQATSMTGGPGSGGGSSSGGALPGCYCSCNVIESIEAACAEHCAPTFLACEGKRAGPETLAALAYQPTRVDVAAAQAEGEPWLESLPEAQTWLDQQVAARLLDAAGVNQRTAEWIETAYSQVEWAATDNRQQSAGLTLWFQGLDGYDSRRIPADELQLSVLGFNALQAKSVERPKGLGNIAFLTDFGDSSSLVVLTGIYGKAWDSDDFGTELVVTYTLAQSTLSHDERGNRLIDLATPQIEQLLASALRQP